MKKTATPLEAAPVSVQELADRFVFGNLDGTWAVWKRWKKQSEPDSVGGSSVGPGYIGRARLRDGTLLCDGFYPTATSANDPRVQGIGMVGYHWYRQPEPYPGNEPNFVLNDVWEYGWDIDGHKPGPFGVTNSAVIGKPYVKDGKAYASFNVALGDGWTPDVMFVRYDYVVHPSQVQMWVTITTLDVEGARPFIKEPKICVGLNPPTEDGSRYDSAQVFRADGTHLVSFPLEIGDPTKKTRQIGFDTRARVRFFGKPGTPPLNIVARASEWPLYEGNRMIDGERFDWEGSKHGLDRWAQLSNDRKRLADTPCKPYCLQGPSRLTKLGTKDLHENTLTRQWEIAKRPGEPGVELMLHAWEGGSGLPDCLCCAREYLPGERYTTYLSISRGAGWTL